MTSSTRLTESQATQALILQAQVANLLLDLEQRVDDLQRNAEALREALKASLCACAHVMAVQPAADCPIHGDPDTAPSLGHCE